MKSRSKVVLTGAVAGAMAMGAFTGVIFTAPHAHAEDAASAGASVGGSATTGTSGTSSTNNDASGGVLASSDTSTSTEATAGRDYGGSTLNSTSSEPHNLTTEQGADTDARMREAESRQTGSRGSLNDDEPATVDADVDTSARINTDLDNAATDSVDAEAAADASADTDARMREAESRMSGSRGSLSSDTTAGADENAQLRDQIRNDPGADMSVTSDSEDEPRSGGLLGLFRGNASANVNTNGGTQIGAGGELQ